MKGIYAILVYSFISLQSNAQNVTGHWYGIGKVAVPGEHSSYMSELIIKQKGNAVSGELQYYFRDSLFKVKVSGNFNSGTRKLIFKPIPFIYYLSSSTKNGIDCILTGNFTLLINRTESVLTGAFESDAAHRYTSPDIQFRFRYSTDTIPLKEELIVEEETADNITDSTSTKVDNSISIPLPVMDPIFRSREKVYVRDIEITSNTIQLQLYDNGTIDNDSISVFLNDRIVVAPVQLSHRAIKKTISLDSSLEVNELSMFAVNLGTIPPNTAAMIIYDGDKRHELILTSDLKNTATIRLRRKIR
jgi:hypothetical protein